MTKKRLGSVTCSRDGLRNSIITKTRINKQKMSGLTSLETAAAVRLQAHLESEALERRFFSGGSSK